VKHPAGQIRYEAGAGLNGLATTMAMQTASPIAIVVMVWIFSMKRSRMNRQAAATPPENQTDLATNH
jgi:hypothetical protein